MSGGNDDQQLIEACRSGRTEAFGGLIRRYQDRLYPTALRLTGRPEDALDLLQDAFLRAFQKLDRFHGDSSFYTWIYRIMVNLALSERRKRRKPGRSEVSLVPDLADTSERSDPADALNRSERDFQVQNALNALAPDHRAVVVMKEFDGLRYEEIASMLDVPVGTVRSRLHRARCELRDRLRDLILDDQSAPRGPGEIP
ncbi:sigma-70 family RNA polymerase sigma factor [Isosphaeraceae bacterium EP7]